MKLNPEHVKIAMIRAGEITVTKLAGAVGVSRVYLSNAINGKATVSAVVLAKMGEALGVSETSLLDAESLTAKEQLKIIRQQRKDLERKEKKLQTRIRKEGVNV